MTSPRFFAVALLLVAPVPSIAQVTSRIGTIRTRAFMVDTNKVTFRRPVSRVVLETAWATADTSRRPADDMVIPRPTWASPIVMYRRLAATSIMMAPRYQLATRRVAPVRAAAVTASDDTVIRMQRAADYRVRAEALATVNKRAIVTLHPTVAANLISELDSVGSVRFSARLAVTPPESNPEEEDYSEYVVSLARAVVRLKDPTAVRAVALGGLGTSREAQRFVAAQGTSGLGVLDTAFAANEALAPSVVTTWGYSLAGVPSKLSFADSVHIYARIGLSAQYHPVSFTHAVRIAKLFEFLPELDSLIAQAQQDTAPAVLGAARVARKNLMAVAASAKAKDWLARLRLRIGLHCIDASRLGPPSCRRMLAATVSAGSALGRPAALREALQPLRAELGAAATERRMNADVRARLDALIDSLLKAPQ